MTRFFFLSIFCHLLLLSLVLFFQMPKPPKVFQTKIFFSTPNALPKPAVTKKKISPIKTPPKVIQKAPVKPTLPKLVTSSSLKLQGIDLENINLNDFEIKNQLEQESIPTNLDLKEIQEQKPNINLEQLQLDLETPKPKTKPIISNKQDTKTILNTEQFSDNIYIQNYQSILAAIVKSNWNNALQDTNLKTRVKIHISQTGELLEYEVLKKSNVISFDLSVTNALEISAPFPVFPENLTKKSQVFYFQFQGGGNLISQ